MDEQPLNHVAGEQEKDCKRCGRDTRDGWCLWCWHHGFGGSVPDGAGT